MSEFVVIPIEELEARIEAAVERAVARHAPAPAHTKPPALLDREEAQDRLCMSRSAFYELRKRKKLEPVFVGPRQPRYRSEDIDRIMAEGTE